LHHYRYEADQAHVDPSGKPGQDGWVELNCIPRPFVEVDPLTDPTGQTTLPLSTPNFQEYEIAKDPAPGRFRWPWASVRY
jgi:hypothetical protein